MKSVLIFLLLFVYFSLSNDVDKDKWMPIIQNGKILFFLTEAQTNSQNFTLKFNYLSRKM